MVKQPKKTQSLLDFKGCLSFLILHELKNKSLYGQELANKIGNRKGARLTPGTIYPALKQLHSMKLITFHSEGNKKIYTLTVLGKQELEDQYLLFSNYFWGLKHIISKKRLVKNNK
ncbi:MAG: PadR family transcriptional regulator [Nanobdellota archaeon]